MLRNSANVRTDWARVSDRHSPTHDHDPDHAHDHGHSTGLGHSHHLSGNEAPSAIKKAIFITLIFMIVELVGGYIANSLALISDGAHMLTDVGAMLVSLFAFWVARKPSTTQMSFGYHRAEILGALVSGLLIWIISGALVYEAVIRMQAPPEVRGPIVFIVASLGLLANFLSMRVLHASKEENLNAKAAYLHVLSDSIGSLGAVIAGAVLWITHWRPIDPIITIAFAALMLFNSWSLVREAVEILMESTPRGVDPTRVRNDLQTLTGVIEAHDLHIWAVSSGRLALSVHLISEDIGSVLNRANDLLKNNYGIIHTTIQVEHPNTFKSERCYDCAPT